MSKKATKPSIDDNLKQLVLMRQDRVLVMGNEALNWDGLSLKQFVNEHFCCL